jgi:hypothetical protein
MKALAGILALVASPLAAEPLPGVPNPAQARIDYMLKCQGCHQPDGAGNTVNTPPLAGTVARLLKAPGGRAFLVRVPGVAMVDLDDTRLAQLVNWTLHRFDRANLPAAFKPYSPAEVAALRRQPLRLDRVATRAALIKQVQTGR